jgi:hypothetical protein
MTFAFTVHDPQYSGGKGKSRDYELTQSKKG